VNNFFKPIPLKDVAPLLCEMVEDPNGPHRENKRFREVHEHEACLHIKHAASLSGNDLKDGPHCTQSHCGASCAWGCMSIGYLLPWDASQIAFSSIDLTVVVLTWKSDDEAPRDV